MKLNKAPCGVTLTVPISKGNTNGNDREDCVKGGILKGTKYSWLCHGPFLKIIDVSSGEKVAGWRFGAACSDFITEVSCALELPNSGDSNLKQIVLGLECEVIGGLICLFDVQGSRLLRAIRIPDKPLSLSIVDSGSSGCEGCYPLPGLLSSMSGIIAVGLQGGSVFLIDLCRLACEELLNTWFNDDREEVRDEINPCQLLPINKDDDDSDKLEKKCASAVVSGDHLCLLLNEGAFVQDNFLLFEPGGEVIACQKIRNIGVTSLLYVPRIASLVVGYSFGCFQIWNLMHLTLNYTSHMMKDPLPVRHLGFQEPSDDPCNFCYLWAVHSSTDEFPSSNHPVGIMYALSYDSKEWIDGYGYLYQDYQSCHFRFEYNLEVDDSEDIDSVCCVTFSTLSNIATQRMPEDGYDEEDTENDFSLSVFAWEAYDTENKPISTYLSIFDLNQWYKDQMPVRITGEDDESLGYLVTFSMNCIRQKGETTSHVETPLLDIQIDPKNLSQFKSFQPQEEHFHPSALSFVSNCLLEDKVVFVSHPGLQHFLLLCMEKEGPICLLRPVNLFKHCVMVGLKPLLMDINGSSEVSASTQREFLLSIALENQMLGFLHKCASDWANGSVSGADCSLPMLLTWGFERAFILKNTGDSLCTHLFDHTGVRLDKNECKLLDNCATQLRQLATLFEGIMSDCRLISLLDLDDFKEKTNALNLFALYFEVLQWFLNVGLLPEFPENYFDQVPSETCDTSFQKIPYPSTVLTKFYSDRRLEFRNLNLKNGTKACLYIDQLLENECSSSELVHLWQNDGGSGMYPPPSIQSLLAMFLLDGIDVQTKNSIVIYVFLDLASILDSERYSRTIEYFVKFPCAFCMTPSIIKVTQAFWLLDQKLFEDALDMVLDPLVSPKDLQPWQHRFMVHALLSQGQHCKALEYFTVRQLPIQGIEDIQLKISLLVMNKQVTQAYNFLQQYNIEENNKKLLYHFYQECGKARQLGTVLKLMLSPAEEELLMSYLQNCNIAQSEDMQVVFYLMRSRVIEAVAVNEKINFSGNRKVGARRIRNDPSVRDVLVGGYAKTLPSVTRQLANYCSQQKKLLSHWRQVQRPTPMSVDVNYGTKQPVSYKSSLIHATLEKARETWMVPDHSSYNAEARNKEMDVSAMQNLPFLCTTHDSLRHERETTPVVFPSVTNSIKRQLEEDEMVSTPFKRSRLDSSPLMENFLLPNKKKDICEKEHNSSSLLLKSPLVKRITPLKRMNDTSQQESSVSKPYTESFTPHSILKVRNLVRSSVSPEHTRKESEEKVSKRLKCGKQEERLCARQIRFSLPVSNELEECQPLSSSTPTEHNKIKSPNRIVNASPRLPLRSSLSLLQKLNGGVNIESSLTNVPEKSLQLSKNPAEDKSLENDIFILHSEENSDELYVKDGKSKLNDSLEEESFHSAPSSNNSLIVEEDNVTDAMNDDEGTGTSHSLKNFIHNIKEIKSRKQLSRLKSVTQHTDSQIPNTNVNILENNLSAEKTSVEMQITTRNSFEKKVMECSFIPEKSFDAKSEISFKKSILGDTNFIENSSNSSKFSYEHSISTSSGNDSVMKNISGNEKSEINEETEGHLVTKIEHIKARRPLSRIRKSGNFDETLGNSQSEKSSFLETTKDKKEDILPDYSNINLSLAEMDEEDLQKEDGTFVGDNVPKTSDLYQERNEIQFSEEMEGSSSFTFSTSKENTMKCVNSTVEDEEAMHITQISPNLIHDTSFQDSRDVLFLSEEKSNEDFVTVGDKTYASLSAVTTEQSSCESVFPNQHNENHSFAVPVDLPEDPRIVFPDRSIAEKTYSAQFTQIHPSISIQESLVKEGDEEVCVDAVFECVKPNIPIDNYSKVATFSRNLNEQGSSSTGDTSGTIELDSDESEEKVSGKQHESFSSICGKNDSHKENNEIIVIDSDSECNEVISRKQSGLYAGESTPFIHEASLISKQLGKLDGGSSQEYCPSPHADKSWSQELHGSPLGLKLSDSENDTDSSSDSIKAEKIKESLEPVEECDNGNMSLALKPVIVESNIDTSLQTKVAGEKCSKICEDVNSSSVISRKEQDFSEKNIMDVNNGAENEGNLLPYSKPCILSDSPLKDNQMGSETVDSVLATHQENQGEIKHNSEKLIDSNLDTHTGISTSESFEERSSYSLVEAQLTSPSKMAVSDYCEPTSNVNETSCNVQEIQKIEQSSFGTSHKTYSLRSSIKTQMNVSTSEVAETSVKDQINQQSIACSQDNVSQVGGPRRRQISIHIEPIIGDPALEQKVDHVSSKNTRQRSHLNSVQSELPLTSDVPSTESSADHEKSYGQMEKPRRRRSSLQIEPVSRGDGSTPENKGVEETYYLRTRSKGRSSSIQSEPPQMSDVLGMDQKVLTPRGSSRQRRHSLQIDTMQMRAESTFAEGGEITENNSTSRRQKGRSNSVQSEPPIMSDVLLNDDFSKHRRRRRGSLQEEPVNISCEQIIEDKAEVHSNAVLNPSSAENDLLEAENKGAENVMQEPVKYQESLRTSLHSEHVQVVGPLNSSSEKYIAVESSSNSSEASAQNVSTCLTNKNNSLLNTAFIENQKSKMVLRSSRAFSLEKDLPGVEDEKKASEFPDLDDSPLNTAFIKSEKLKSIRRSSRASSMDRDLPSVEDGKKTSDFCDSDNCSVQSEPPRLHDVSRTRHSKNLKTRRVSLKRRNSSKKSTYVLKIPSPKLPCVKEEPENETSAGNADEINPSARLQSEINVEESVKCERRKKQPQSVRGHTKSAEEGLIVQRAPSDDADSPTSISSKSTLILDHSSKRKRCTSPSSEEQELKKFQRDNDIPAVSRNVEKTKKKSIQDSNSSDTIEHYATARRLTRYQKTLMERSIEVTKGIYQEFQGRHPHSYKTLEDSDGESEASTYSSGSSIIRSSARLREKQRMTERSPSQSSEMSTQSAQTPEKRLSKRHSLKQISPEGRGDKSPLSIRSGKSTSCGSSVTSSQWPSPDPALTQSPMRPRRKSFQNAQKALYSPAKKHGSTKSSVTSDSSEGVGQSVYERKPMKNTGTASDVGSIQSPSSSTSSPIFQTRNTRPSTKNKKHSKHGATRSAEVQSQKELAQNEDSNTSVSSVETSPLKKT